MKLASEQEVLSLLSIRTTNQATEAVGVALDTATAVAEAILGTDFVSKTRFDRFLIDREHYDRLLKGHFIRLLLEDGYLSSTRIRAYASTKNILRTADATEFTSEFYLVEQEDGVVTLEGLPLTGMQSVGIRYTCGFEETDGVYQDVPAWLKQAAISACLEIMRSHVLTSNKKDNITDMSNQMTRTMRTILYAHIRRRYGGVFPTHSEVS